MKTQLTLTQKKNLAFIGFMMLTLLAFNPIYGQTQTVSTAEIDTNERIIKGIVSDESGPLEGVNVIKGGTRNGTVTNVKGKFTFPNKLKTGDILLFSYLGYKTQKVEIKETTRFITLELNPDMIEMIGALDSGKPYKSKRKN